MILNNQSTVVITQARMTSTRLPGKVLKTIQDKPLLQYHLDRLKRDSWDIIVATTTNESDDPIVDFCGGQNTECFRGPEDDVLARFYNAVKDGPYKTIVRVTSDCPFIDSSLILKGLHLFTDHGDKHSYVSNCFPRTFARGFDFEIFSLEMLKNAFNHALDPFDREHVTPYLWKNKSGNVHLLNIEQPIDRSNLRICVDTKEDFELAERLILDHHAHLLGYSEIETLLDTRNDLVQINAHIEQKKNG